MTTILIVGSFNFTFSFLFFRFFHFMQFLTFIDPVPREQYVWQLLFIINMAYDDKASLGRGGGVGWGWDGPGGGG